MQHRERETDHWHTAEQEMKLTSGDVPKTKGRDHTSRTDFTVELWCWQRALGSTQRMAHENHGRSSGSFTQRLCSSAHLSAHDSWHNGTTSEAAVDPRWVGCVDVWKRRGQYDCCDVASLLQARCFQKKLKHARKHSERGKR